MSILPALPPTMEPPKPPNHSSLDIACRSFLRSLETKGDFKVLEDKKGYRYIVASIDKKDIDIPGHISVVDVVDKASKTYESHSQSELKNQRSIMGGETFTVDIGFKRTEDKVEFTFPWWDANRNVHNPPFLVVPEYLYMFIGKHLEYEKDIRDMGRG